MEEIIIHKYKLKEIQDTLRLTIRINDCKGKTTCYDRMVMKTKGWVDDLLKD